MQRYCPTVIIGAGQSGLAVSAELARGGSDHLVLERGQIANSWKTERWDSLRMLTPNWMNGLPNLPYNGAEIDGFMSVDELVKRFDKCAEVNAAPVQAETTVLSIQASQRGYRIQTDQGAIDSRNVVLANGACGIAHIPVQAQYLPADIVQTTPMKYKRASDLPQGKVLVVGASASGLQIAREVQKSGRDVILSVGNHLRLPRRYRGVDICRWMDLIGTTSIPYDQVDNLTRVRRTPSLSLVAGETLDLNALQRMGVEITGRLVGMCDGRAQFAGSLANLCVAADLKMKRLSASIDAWIAENGQDSEVAEAEPIVPTCVPASPRLSVNLEREGIRSVIWATGYKPDFSWLNLPVFDPKGQIIHDGGVIQDGLYVMGLPYLRQRKSTFLHGATDDAMAVVDHMVQAGRIERFSGSHAQAA